MIISQQAGATGSSFESLLTAGINTIQTEATRNPRRYRGQSSSDFEKEVYHALDNVSNGTEFQGSIELISGHKFPDIIAKIAAKKFYGVEVKKTETDNWRSTGNSVLESTRIDNVEKIYLFFGKLVDPPKFKFRKYEECLYDIAVTHSPRYLIDMELGQGITIFDKMRIDYDTLRKSDNPIKEVVKYFRKICRPGEEPWWMDVGGGEVDAMLSPIVTLWCNLPAERQNHLKSEAMARFPEIFGNRQTKYQNLAAWLAARHGVVDSSLRDRFTAGGQQTIEINGNFYHRIPKIFDHLKRYAKEVIDIVSNLTVDDARHHWDPERRLGNITKEELVDKWVCLVIKQSEDILPNNKKFIVHLLGAAFGECKAPPSLTAAMRQCALRY